MYNIVGMHFARATFTLAVSSSPLGRLTYCLGSNL